MSKYNKERFESVVKNSINISDVCRNLGLTTYYGNRQTIKKYIEKYNVDISHFRLGISIKRKTEKLEDILVENSTYIWTSNLKNKLYNCGLKKRVCEFCNQSEIWNGMKISLILDHKNGINNDNRIENLRILCPNCNASLDTHGGKNIKYKYKYEIKKYFCNCGNEITKGSKICKKCSSIKQRKVKIRPTYEQLLNDIKKLNYTNTGKKYGVSDNTIRKWLKNYKK